MEYANPEKRFTGDEFRETSPSLPQQRETDKSPKNGLRAIWPSSPALSYLRAEEIDVLKKPPVRRFSRIFFNNNNSIFFQPARRFSRQVLRGGKRMILISRPASSRSKIPDATSASLHASA